MLTVQQAAEILRVCPRTVKVRITRGELEASRAGNRYLLRPQAIEEYFMRNLVVGKVSPMPRKSMPCMRARDGKGQFAPGLIGC